MAKACIDVSYTESSALAACVVFESWNDTVATEEISVAIAPIEPYVPGEFYRREMPCILRVLKEIRVPIDTVVVDGYVWLGENRKGLGAHLFEALGGVVPVIGVAKTEFQGATPVLLPRQPGVRPLYITSVGMDPHAAANAIGSMHGTARIPTLLKYVDKLSRGK